MADEQTNFDPMIGKALVLQTKTRELAIKSLKEILEDA